MSQSIPGMYRLILLLFVCCAFCIACVSAAPYSIGITPKSAEVPPGGTVTYNVRIDAQPGFNEPIDFSIDVSSAGYQTTVNAGTYKGPYPRSFTYNLQVPSSLPGGINAKAMLNARSGTDLVQVPLDISITGSGGPLESIISAITSFINTIQSAISRVM